MRKIILTLAMIILFAASAFGASVTRRIASRVNPGEEITVVLDVDGIGTSDAVKTFAIEESVPVDWTLSDWSITGIVETKDEVVTDFKDNNYKFQFTPTGTSSSISYKTTALTELGTYDFKATWFDLTGMSGANDGKTTVAVREITCGDGFCEGSENSDNCEGDCPKPVPPTPPAEEKGKVNVGLIIIALIVIIGLIAYFVYKKKK
jgi:hypothetical protein